MPSFILEFLPEGASPVWAITAMAVAVVVIGIAKSGFGGGIGILAVPLMAAAIDPAAAIGVMLPILITADIFAVGQHRKHVSGRHLRITLAGSLAGVVLGSILLWQFAETQSINRALNLTVGSVCVLLVLLQCYRMLGGKVARIPDNRPAGLTAGGLAGFVSTLAHAAGPIMSVYLLEHRLDKRRIVGTLAVFFFLLNLLKVPSFVGLDYINSRTLLLSLACLPLVPVGSLLGYWMHGRIRERPFTLIMYMGAFAAGLRMVYKAFA
jgi:uncharacterized membrane protein YfcA